MDTIEYYIGDAEALLGRDWTEPLERIRALEQSIRSIITAWDAENIPDL